MKAGVILLSIFVLIALLEGRSVGEVTGRRLFRRGTHESTIEAPEGDFAKKRAVSDSVKPRGKNNGKSALAEWTKPKASSDPSFNRGTLKTSKGSNSYAKSREKR